MAEHESTTDTEHIPPPTPPPKDSSPTFRTEPSLITLIDRERDQLSKAFGVCKTLKHALMYSDGDMDMNAPCYSDCADAAADIIDKIHANLETINKQVVDLIIEAKTRPLEDEETEEERDDDD